MRNDERVSYPPVSSFTKEFAVETLEVLTGSQ